MTSCVSVQEVVAHLEHKTAAILQRYGPGPRVHYHAGLVDHPPHSSESVQSLRQRLVASQERMLTHAAKIWDAPSTLSGDVLDVGCGLGGGAIYWAHKFGAQVTAVTCVPSHARATLSPYLATASSSSSPRVLSNQRPFSLYRLIKASG